MTLREMQLMELDMLKVILPILEENNLRYYMLGGTFLGAIRHKGFIPWDDDIDIGMPRPDYEKFISIAESTLPSNLLVKDFKSDDAFKNYFAKLFNVNVPLTRSDNINSNTETYLWIDIFPLDGMPNGKIRMKLHKFHLLYRRLMLQYSKFYTGVNIKKKRSSLEKLLITFGYLFTKFIHLNTNKQLHKLDKVLTKYTYENSNNVVNFMGAYKFKEMFPKKLYEDAEFYDFEDTQLKAPKDYDTVLRQLYGEYMNPPPENQRFSHSVSTSEN